MELFTVAAVYDRRTSKISLGEGFAQRTEEGEQATELRGQVRSQVQLGNEGEKSPPYYFEVSLSELILRQAQDDGLLI